MADEKNQLALEIAVEVTKALKDLDKFERESKKAVGASEQSFKALKAAAAGAVAYFSAKAVYDFFDAGVDAAIAQQDAMSGLAFQMEQTGEFTDEALKSFEAFANEMEATTKYGDDLVVSQLAVAKSFGVANEAADDLVKAAADLSASSRGTLKLEDAVKQLAKTYSGTTGKLDEMVPALRGLTKEQLANGEAVRIIAERYGGAAQAEIENFSGKLTQAKNAFGNLQEAFGEIIITNGGVIEAIGLVREIFSELETAVSDSSGGMHSLASFAAQGFATGISLSVEAVGYLVTGLEGFVTVGGLALGTISQIAAGLALFTPLSDETVEAIADFSDAIVEKTAAASVKFDDFRVGFSKFQASIDQAAQKVFEADGKVIKSAGAATQARSAFVDAAAQDAKELEKLAEQARSFEASLRQSTSSEYENTIAKLNEQLAKIQEFESQRVISAQKSSELRILAEQNANDKLEKLLQEAADEAADQAKKVADEFRAAVAAAGTDPMTFYIGKLEIDPLAMDEAHKDIAAALGTVTLALQGQDGARKAISGLAGAAADAFIPGMGAAVGPLVDALAAGPEQSKAMIRGFVEGIPEIIDNIAESMPAIVEALVDSLINKGGIIKIAVSLAKAMAGVAIWKALGKQIFSGIDFGNVGSQIGESLSKGFNDLVAFDKRFRETIATFTGQKKLFEADERLRKTFTDGAKRLFASIGDGATKLFEFDKKIRTAFADALASVGLKIGAAFTSIFQKATQIKLPPLKIPDLLVVGQKMLEASTGAAQALYKGIADGAQKLFEFDGKLRAAAANAAMSLWSGIAGLFSFEFKAPSWLQGFLDTISAMTTGPEWASTLGTALSDLSWTISSYFSWFTDNMFALFNWLPDAIASIFGGGGGSGGYLGQLYRQAGGSATGMDEVPPGFPNDTYLRRLTSGEGILDARTNDDLRALAGDYRAGRLDGLAGGGGDVAELLTKVIDLLQQPVVVKAETKVNERVLSESILTLNRRSQRLA